MNAIAYRLYPNGSLVSEDSFNQYDNMLPYYDDYYVLHVPIDIEGEDAVRKYFDDAMNHEAAVYHSVSGADRNTTIPEVMTVPYGSLNNLI
jgi:hypothetical protein